MGSTGVGTWSIILTRNLNDWEIDEYMRLLNSLSPVLVPTGATDEPFIESQPKWPISVKSLYLHLDQDRRR